jgi:hypothetical protein
MMASAATTLPRRVDSGKVPQCLLLGSVDILAMLTWLMDHGYLPQGSVLDNGLGYGFEICSTGGVAEDLEVTSFSITTSP